MLGCCCAVFIYLTAATVLTAAAVLDGYHVLLARLPRVLLLHVACTVCVVLARLHYMYAVTHPKHQHHAHSVQFKNQAAEHEYQAKSLFMTYASRDQCVAKMCANAMRAVLKHYRT